MRAGAKMMLQLRHHLAAIAARTTPAGERPLDAELIWKWLVRSLLAMLLLLANALLVIAILNAPRMFSAADELRQTARSLQYNANALGDAADSVSSQVGHARIVFGQMGEDFTRASRALERAGADIKRFADGIETISSAVGR